MPRALAGGWSCESSECHGTLIHSNGLQTQVVLERGEQLHPAKDVTVILRKGEWKPVKD